MDAGIRSNILEFAQQNNIRVPNYTLDMFGLTHPKQEEEEHESKEDEGREDEEWEEDEEMDFEEDGWNC